MKSNLVRLDYQGIAVSFNEDGWFNATHAAAPHGKRPVDWLALDSTKEYIATLCDLLNCEKSSLLKTKAGRHNGGTWLHPRLAVVFARWLDVRFAIWCDIQIEGLLKGQHPHYDWKRLRHEASSSFKVMNDILATVRAEQGKATVVYHFTNEARLVNWALSGEFKGIDRDALPSHDLDLLAKLELKNATLIGRGVGYPDRKKILESAVLELRLLLPALPHSEAAA
jgi:hypothetical protein